MLRLETKQLILREIHLDDWRDAQALDADPLVVRYQSNDVLGPEGTQEYLQRSIAAAAETPRKIFDLAITLRGEDRYLGRVGLEIVRPEHREATLWFNLRRDLWGKGFGTEASRAMVDFGFHTLKLHRIFGDCDPRNQGSARLMEKLGLKREAHLRENWWLKGEWCDSYIYAVLEHEWPTAPSKS